MLCFCGGMNVNTPSKHTLSSTVQVNGTHIEFKNRMSVRLRAEEVISRRDLKIVWVCVYPRHYVRNTHVSVGMERWETFLSFSVMPLLTCFVNFEKTESFHKARGDAPVCPCRLQAFSVVQFNSSLQLLMALYTDASFSNTYNSIIQLWSDDFLFVEVRLQTNNTFASDVLLQVESCWATEDRDPDNPIQGVLLQDRCEGLNSLVSRSSNGRWCLFWAIVRSNFFQSVLLIRSILVSHPLHSLFHFTLNFILFGGLWQHSCF